MTSSAHQPPAFGITLKMIHDRCDEVGDCWIWRHATNQNGNPIMRKRPASCLSVRRIAVELDGRPAQYRQPVMATCGDKLCCNPAHLRLGTHSAVAKAAAKNGAWSTAAHAAKIAKGIRSQRATKLTIEDARAIRASTEPTAVLVQHYGVHKSLICGVRSGRYWKEYGGSPWAGLGGREHDQ